MWVMEPGSFINKQDAGGSSKGGPEVQDVMCVEFLATGSIVTGMASGDIYLWKPIPDSCAMLCDKILMIPGKDPKDPKQKAHLHTVQVLKIRYVRNASGDAVPTLLSGGGGGKIKIWKDLDGEVPIFAHEIELPKKQGERAKIPPQVEVGFNGRGQPPAIKALDCFPGADDLVVGTDKCDVWKIKLVAKPDGTFEPAVPTMLVKGHTDDVNGIDVHPTREYLFASCAMSDMVYLWDANLKSLVGQASLKGRRGMCCAFRGDAKHLAIGTYDGCVYVFKELNDWEGDSLRLQKVPEMGIWPLRDCVSQIQELKYSPDLRTLAVARPGGRPVRLLRRSLPTAASLRRPFRDSEPPRLVGRFEAAALAVQRVRGALLEHGPWRPRSWLGSRAGVAAGRPAKEAQVRAADHRRPARRAMGDVELQVRIRRDGHLAVGLQ
jgi:WD40 repeat protein